MANITEEPKANLVSKTIDEMVADLKYSQGMLQANVETAQELGDTIVNYLNKTNMGDYYETVKTMSEEKINEMTIKDIDNMFPGNNLMPWDAVDVKDIEGEYGYTEDEYHQFLIELHNRCMDYEHIVKLIDQARGYVHKMADKLQEVRLEQAKKVAATDTPEAKKARQYIQDIDDINFCRPFVNFIRTQKENIILANTEYMTDRFNEWLKKNGRFSTLIDTIMNCDTMDISVENRKFLCKAIMSYVRYAAETTNREIIIKRSILTRIVDFFTGNMDPKYADTLKNELISIM